ncbi:MAG: nitrogen fixation protein [Alphaproteobacteria bacterium]|nr:nitrogen fixation protein [Alphaproteobacteria bacterium]
MSGGGRGRPSAAPLACPSADPDWDDARLLGVVLGTAEEPQTWFTGVRPVDPAMLAAAAPAAPAEVFRFTARCREGACAQFVGGRCRVGEAVAAHLPPAEAQALPQCGLRPACRWWHEQGPAACRRCPAVVTQDSLVRGAYTEALRGQGDPERVTAE